MDFCKYIDSFCIWYSRNNLLLVDQEPRNQTVAARGGFPEEKQQKGHGTLGGGGQGWGGPEGAY